MYLMWFDALHRPLATREHVLLFREGRPDVRSGPPGLLLEATQVCQWEEVDPADVWEPGDTDEEFSEKLEEYERESAPSYNRFNNDWWSESPKSKGEGKIRIVRSPLAVGTGRSRDAYTSEPWWVFEDTPRALGRIDGWHREVRSIVQNVVSVLLGRAQEREKWRPTLESFKLETQWRLLRSRQPSERYELIRDFIENSGHAPGTRPSAHRPAGLELWTVVEVAHACYHSFPKMWLKRFRPVDFSAPSFCFFAQNWWIAALIEIAWAVEQNVWAGQCSHAKCDVWFLQAGRQGGRREFCSQHQDGGPVIRYRMRLKEKFPEVFRVKEQMRFLAAKRRRGTISATEFTKKRAELKATLQWYRDQGLTPRGARG